MSNSLYLAGLTPEQSHELRSRLNCRQSSVCYICGKLIDLVLMDGQLDVDHIQPLAVGGSDSENNFALTLASCNRSKGASDLRVAQMLSKLASMQEEAKEQGSRGVNLGHVLAKYGGSKAKLHLTKKNGRVEFSFPASDNNDIQSENLRKDKLSGMDYFFTVVPLEYLHHDDVINPRISERT